jgi:hypothetical protein
MNQCRDCVYWKRRGLVTGTCWQRADAFPEPKSETKQDDSCEYWQAKLLLGHEMQRVKGHV